MEWLIIFALASSCYVIHKVLIYCYENGRDEMTKTWRYVLGWLVFLLVFGSFYYYEDSKNIKDGGTYYVNLFEKEDGQKNYRVPGIISATEDGYGLIVVFWSNGGELTFYDSYSDLIIGEKVSIQDDTDKEWFVELTEEKAEVKK
jgi:hypothetical protein